jgi:hypothetical protein
LTDPYGSTPLQITLHISQSRSFAEFNGIFQLRRTVDESKAKTLPKLPMKNYKMFSELEEWLRAIVQVFFFFLGFPAIFSLARPD